MDNFTCKEKTEVRMWQPWTPRGNVFQTNIRINVKTLRQAHV